MGTFGRLVFCEVRTQLVGETSVSRQVYKPKPHPFGCGLVKKRESFSDFKLYHREKVINSSQE
jgi:hypothetical protein